MYRKHSDFDILSASYFAFLIVCIAIIYYVFYTCMQISFKTTERESEGDLTRSICTLRMPPFSMILWLVLQEK